MPMMTQRTVWSPLFGLGRLELGLNLEVEARFDSGTIVKMQATRVHASTPTAYALMNESRNERRIDWGTRDSHGRLVPSEMPEWMRWDTYADAQGNVLVVRRDGPPPEGTPKPEDTVLRQKGARRSKQATAPGDGGEK